MKKSTETGCVWLGGKAEPYTLTRKPVKNVNIRLNKVGDILVSAPPSLSIARIEAILTEHERFLLKAKERLLKKEQEATPLLLPTDGTILPIWGEPHTLYFQKGGKWGAKRQNSCLFLTLKNPENAEARTEAVKRFLKTEAEAVLTPLVTTYQQLFSPYPKDVPTLSFRMMTSKWGICRPQKKTVTLNCNLVYFNLSHSEYVVCHELAHFKHPDHSDRFWWHLTAVRPECKERRRALNALTIPRISSRDTNSKF